MNRRDTLLIVDDMEINRAVLASLFEEEYNVLEAENGEQALILLKQHQDHIEAMLLDLVMPVIDGYQVIEDMGRCGLLSKVPVVVITSDDTTESEVRAFDLGASDIIMKPFEPHVVKRRVRNIVELYRHKLHLEELVKEQSERLRESNTVIIDALSSVIEYRNLESGQHIRRIRLFTKILLEDVARCYQEYELDEHKIAIITDASSMHDIGKIAIPDAILNKPGRLTTEEFEIMKTHTTQGCEILAGLERMNDKEYLRYAYNICRYHHERWDGRGYPDGLRGENIPICAQVVAIADCYDALTMDRVYKKAIPQEQAFQMIMNGECGSFSPRIRECFRHVKDAFADLSREYADGRSLKTDYESQKPGQGDAGIVAMEDEQLKYVTLLRYVNSTVMEVDFGGATHYVSYLGSKDFESLRTGESFEEAMRAFASQAVHPKDQALVLELTGSYIMDFFREGLLKKSRRYRIRSQETGEYYWCTATILRMDLQNPRTHKAMFIWRKDGGE